MSRGLKRVHVPGSYCQNLSQTEIAQQPATPGQYRDFQCVLPLNTIFWILVAEWLVYLALAVYLDNIIPDENGSRRASLPAA